MPKVIIIALRCPLLDYNRWSLPNPVGRKSFRFDRVTINTLPDDVLVDIFYFYLNEDWAIGSMTHNWRILEKRPMFEIWDVWPVLPVVMTYRLSSSSPWENVVDALESDHYHRICQIALYDIPKSGQEILATAMQKPFPELTRLHLCQAEGSTPTSLRDSFLGGSAPLLRYLLLNNCSFPGIYKLLLSANQLVELDLFNIPDSGYISPQDFVTALSVMSRLESLLCLGFQSHRYPASRPPPLTRSVLPALTYLVFHGVHEYLEDVLAQVEVPLLNKLHVTFFMDLNFVIPQLHHLIGQAESFKTGDEAIVHTSCYRIEFMLFEETRQFPELSLNILCRESDRQLASLAQLDIVDDTHPSHWKNDMEITQWLELLDPFTAVEDLRLSDNIAPHVCRALEELAEERVTEVLPALENIFLSDLQRSGSGPKYIEGFVDARERSGHPVAVRYVSKARCGFLALESRAKPPNITCSPPMALAFALQTPPPHCTCAFCPTRITGFCMPLDVGTYLINQGVGIASPLAQCCCMPAKHIQFCNHIGVTLGTGHGGVASLHMFFLHQFSAAMQKPFPEPTYLEFRVGNITAMSLPDSFLGGSAPLLRLLKLVQYLNTFALDSDPLYIRQVDRPPPPLTRSVLPALRELVFKGVHEYLEDLLAQIEAPLLTTLHVTFFMDIDFVLSQLHRLISKTESFKTCDRATVRTSHHGIEFKIFEGSPRDTELYLEIRCRELDWQLASLAQLDIVDYAQSHWKDDMETTQWLELLTPFTAMKDLRLTHQVAPHVSQALEELAGERVTEVLPALQNIFLEGLGALE
ncbi:hypothetical protein F5148DRAFT_1153908 [Russula earlei]|uniref:Uncharacterized protein n=1 Tax=Russula earlei TaxID=71964 RepID=A0ACC0TSJ7_9AGAM|nr:hypothetical protein F5148DRAFT_1153908 [Russula earlei]